jgi:hypothetical protein
MCSGRNPVQALSFAASQAAIEYATEKMPLGLQLKDIGKNALLKNTVINQLKSEMPGEQLATAAQTLIATIVGGGGIALGKSLDSVLTSAQEKQQRAQTATQFSA